jgi:hypothetical protein
MGQKAPKGPASHPLGFETDVGRHKSAALIYALVFICFLKEIMSSASPRFFDSFFIKEKRMPCGEHGKHQSPSSKKESSGSVVLDEEAVNCRISRNSASVRYRHCPTGRSK